MRRLDFLLWLPSPKDGLQRWSALSLSATWQTQPGSPHLTPSHQGRTIWAAIRTGWERQILDLSQVRQSLLPRASQPAGRRRQPSAHR